MLRQTVFSPINATLLPNLPLSLSTRLPSLSLVLRLQVLEWVRNMVANRLSSTGEQWTAVFSKYNSGTYNNQVSAVRWCSGQPKDQVEWQALKYPAWNPHLHCLPKFPSFSRIHYTKP